MQLFLAELLTLRKELQKQVNKTSFPVSELTEVKQERIQISDGIEKVTDRIKIVPVTDIMKDFLVKIEQLRRVDAAIQKTNSSSIVKVRACTMAHFPDKSDNIIEVTLSDALLRRKELDGIITHLMQIVELNIYRVTPRRVTVIQPSDKNHGMDEVTVTGPRIDKKHTQDVLNWMSNQMRNLDAVIQQSNWTIAVNVEIPPNPENVDSKVAA